MEEGLHEGLKYLQAREVGLIPEVVDIGEDMSLRILLRIESTMKTLNRGLDTLMIKLNNICRNRGKRRGGGKGLNTVDIHTQVENSLGIHLRYLQIL